MVRSRPISPAREVMFRAPWLLFHVLVALALLSSQISASSTNKITDVAGDEGAIDELEALLHHRSAAAGGAAPGTAAHRRAGAQSKAEGIQFGVGPSDPRYFDRPQDAVRPNTLQTRSQAPLGPAYGHQNPDFGLPNPEFSRQNSNFGRQNHLFGLQNTEYRRQNPEFGLQNTEYRRQNPDFGLQNLEFRRQNPDFNLGSHGDLSRSDRLKLRGGQNAIADLRFAGADSPQIGADAPQIGADPAQIDAYDQFLGDLSDQYDSAFSDMVASRLAGYDLMDPRSEAFMTRLRDVLRSGDRDAAERMLGVPSQKNALGFQGLREMKATSQPEFVHFNHQQQPHNRQAQQPSSYDPTSKTTTQTSEDPKNDYNPNDPSSSVNKANHSEAALGGTQLAGLPQHLGQSQHSASASQAVVQSAPDEGGFSDVYFTAMVAGCTAAAVCFIIGTGVCWYRLNRNQRAAKDTEYPAYGVTGPSRELSPGAGPGGDRNLAHSAHMYHYQQQKNQMIALDKSGGSEGPAGGGTASDVDSEEEEDGEERDYTVYECPGLAPMGEMVVPNPMYPPEDVTPASPSLKDELPGRAERD